MIEPTPTGETLKRVATTPQGERIELELPRGQTGKEYDPFQFYMPPGHYDRPSSVHCRLAALAPPRWHERATCPEVWDEMRDRAPAMLKFANEFGLPTCPHPVAYQVPRFAREAASLRDLMRLGAAADSLPTSKRARHDLETLLASLDTTIGEAWMKTREMGAYQWDYLRDNGSLRDRVVFAFLGMMNAALLDTRLVFDLPILRDDTAEFSSETLLAACFTMYYLDLKRGEGTRRCRNDRCPTGYFVPERTNQWYCSARCRCIHNQRNYRRRESARI